MIKRFLLGALAVYAFALYTMGCVTDADNPNGNLPQGLSQVAPPKGPNSNPPQGGNQTTPAADDVAAVVKGTVFENQQLDDVTRLRDLSPPHLVDRTKAGSIGGRHLRVGNANGNSNITVIQHNFGVLDADGKTNDDPAKTGRSITQVGSTQQKFVPTVTILSIDKDTWTLFQANKTIPIEFKTYTMLPVGNSGLYQAEVETPAVGIYIVNFSRVEYSEILALNGAPAPADWFPRGLGLNSGFDMAATPRGIMCYARQVNGQPKFGVIEDGSQKLPADAVTVWPSPAGSSGGSGGSSGGGSTNQPPVITAASIAPTASGSTSSIYSGLSPVLSISATDADGDPLTYVVRHASGATGNGPVGITALTSSSFALSNLLVTQRTTVTLEVTVGDTIASVNTNVQTDLLLPNRFAGIAPLGTWIVMEMCNAQNIGVQVNNRTRNDGFPIVLIDTQLVKADGTAWTTLDVETPRVRALALFATINGNSNNNVQAGEVPHGYPGGNVQGGNNGVPFSIDHGLGVYEFRIPATTAIGTSYYINFARKGQTDPTALVNSDYMQLLPFLSGHVEGKGIALTNSAPTATTRMVHINWADAGIDPKKRPGGQYDGTQNLFYPYDAP